MKKQIERVGLGGLLDGQSIAASGTQVVKIEMKHLLEGFLGFSVVTTGTGTLSVTAKVGTESGNVCVSSQLATDAEKLLTDMAAGTDYVDVFKALAIFSPFVELTFTESGGANAIVVTVNMFRQ